MVHGEKATRQAEIASAVLFGGLLDGVEEATFNELVETDDFDEGKFKIQEAALGKAAGEIPRVTLESVHFEGAGAPLLELIVRSGLSPSKGQARKDIEGGGIYVNNIREIDVQKRITREHLLYGKHLLLRKGKRNYVVVTAK
jgi:tyrosyl-tRNA synthetase